MPNRADVSVVTTVRGGATMVLPLTLCNAEWARCQRDAHDEGWGDYGPLTYSLQCRLGCSQRDAHGEG